MIDTIDTPSLSLKEAHSRKSCMNTIESSVTRLLVSTKHLLESLTQWARQKADDKFVSDAYVKLGNDFRAATRAFTNAGVDISDLGDVPKALRIVLESALSESPTQENLDRFLPNIRNIIVNLLSNLKAKQFKAKELSGDGQKDENPSSSLTSTTSPTFAQKRESSESRKKQNSTPMNKNTDRNSEGAVSKSLHIPSDSSDALAKLQKGNFILRRASKRFSAYQFAKLTNSNNAHMSKLSGDLSKSTELSFEEHTSDIPATRTSTIEEPQSSPVSVTIFLRVEEITKRVRLHLPISMASLRLKFVEKFAFSPKSSDFPDIYALDHDLKIWFVLEDFQVDEIVKNGTLLTLKSSSRHTEVSQSSVQDKDWLDQKLRSFSTKLIEEIKSTVLSLERKVLTLHVTSHSDKQLEVPQRAADGFLGEILQELQQVQTEQTMKSRSLRASAELMLLQVGALKATGLADGGNPSNRSYMQQSYSKLSEDSDNLLTKVDDLQDMMEALRKDVAQRGVRLDPKQLKSTRQEIQDVRHLLTDLNHYIIGGKPTWKQIWEAELDKVCEEQQFFNLQNDLTSDLEEDIRKLEETFDLIEKCSLQQSKQTQSRRSPFPSMIKLQEPGENFHNLRDAIMNEVSSLIPDHDNRLEAIAKAEKLRQKERQFLTVSEFQEELIDFVDDKKFKSSGGFEKVERERQEKDKENLKLSMGVF